MEAAGSNNRTFSNQPAMAAYILILLIVAGTTSYYHDFPEVIICMIAIEAAVFIFRRYIALKMKKERSKKESRRLERFAATGLYMAAAVWSLFCIITFQLYGLTLPTIIALISAAGIVSCAVVVLSGEFNRARIFIIILILPFTLWGLCSGHENGFLVSGITALYLIIILKNMGGYSNWFTERQKAMRDLNKHAEALAEMNSLLRSEITYRSRMEKALRKSEELYKTLFENNPIATIIVDYEGRITGLNQARKKNGGRLPKIGDIMYKDYGSRHLNDMYKELTESMKAGKKKEFPEQKYGDRFLDIRISPFSGGAIITSVDITEQKKAEEQIQLLTRELMTVQENERRRISRDLHDSVAQELSTLRISCETFYDDLENGNIAAIKNKIKNISSVLHGSIQTVRDIAYELRPSCLDEFGLGTTLFRYCEEFQSRTDIRTEFFSAGIEKLKIDPEVEINIYRLVQETLNNVKKHSMATQVIIRLVASFPYIILRVEDNGQGFEKDLQEKARKHGKSMGLRGMEERVLLFGGNFRLKSKPGRGTSVIVEIPAVKKNEEIECYETPEQLAVCR